MTCSRLVHYLFIYLSGLVHYFFIIVHDFYMTCLQLVQGLFKACSWPVDNLFRTCSLLAHDLFMTYSWLVHDNSQLVHNIFTTFSWHVHVLFISFPGLADMRIVLLGSGSIFVNSSSSSPNLGIFEANYGLWGNNSALIKVNWWKMALMSLFYDDLWKYYLLFFILSRPNLFGSSILSVWFRKRAARAANNSHVC